MTTLPGGDALAIEATAAIRGGELSALRGLLAEHRDLARARIVDATGTARTLLHVATDWPGYFPHGPAVVQLLLDAGADPNAPVTGAGHTETPLHWAASSDDADVAVVLIDGGADLEASGASIAGGAPLDDAVGYGCWHVARLLVERGARIDRLWQAAALGMLSRVQELLDTGPPPSTGQITEAFWQACHGGQRRVAAFLLDHGADLNGTPTYASATTPLDIASSLDTRREALVSWLRAQGATSTAS
jgi:ankyrin repeat protein